MVICLERGADLHMVQLMPLPLTVSCFSKIQIGFTFLVPAHPGSPGQRAVKRLCVCACYCCYGQQMNIFCFFLFKRLFSRLSKECTVFQGLLKVRANSIKTPVLGIYCCIVYSVLCI